MTRKKASKAMDDRAEMAARIDDAIKRRFKTREAAVPVVGIPLPSLDRYCRGESDVPATRLGQIARGCGVTSDFLIFGEVNPSIPMALASADHDVDGDVVFIPLLDVVASAGPGIENPFPDTIDHLPFPKRWLDELGVPELSARLLELGGDSMEPTIRDRSICLLDIRFQTPRVEGIYALIDGRDVRIKRIGRGWEGKIVLISDNERYESETLAGPDAEALRIAGKIVWAGGKL
ncbi:helix-turn-helix transcriptional regulator [Bosea eneae]|uniref:Helix-turn-helix transcriptional regulator n=1 Tax=Bosea eneae TaxID=151454 RepID=A0ABW0IW97_9HYPH